MGLDSALQRCSVAIARDRATVAVRAADMERGHAEHIAPMTAAVLKEAGARVADLGRIGVVVGPGGFTGVRVALAFARGLGVATGVPVIGLTSLAALAGNVAADDAESLIAPVIDARRGQVYAGLYKADGETLVAPFVAAPDAVFARLVDAAGPSCVVTVGTGAGLLPSLPENWRRSGAGDQIDAAIVARLAGTAPPPAGPPAPLYLRPPDAKPAGSAAPRRAGP